jgi:hypothetical protein
MKRLIGFAWRTFASLGGCASNCKSTGMYPFNNNTVTEYWFSIKDVSESINSTETEPPSTAIVCVTSISATISQILLVISPEPSSTSLSTRRSYNTSHKDFIFSRLLIKISSIREIPEDIQFKKATLFILNEELNNIEEKRKS